MSAFGGVCGSFYSASLNLYFLLVAKSKKKNDDWICRKIEPFLHLVPLVLAISTSLIFSLNGFIDSDSCGIKSDFIATVIIGSVVAVAFVIILGSLIAIYCTVSSQASKKSQYGSSLFRISAKINERKSRREQSQDTFVDNTRTARKKARPAPNSLKVYSQSILKMAKLYTLAFFFMYAPVVWRAFIPVWKYQVSFLEAALLPLTGFWNLLIFMHPKVIAAKTKSSNKITWMQAIIEAFTPYKMRHNKTTIEKKPVVRYPPANLDVNNEKTDSTFQASGSQSRKKWNEEEQVEISDPELGSQTPSLPAQYASNDEWLSAGATKFDLASEENPMRKRNCLSAVIERSTEGNDDDIHSV
mmetsp:Transcript_25492/g.37661  ORF Transcript_25492/g.37661 Transcript_25492/m.37661 type:complete len:357 (-) Transcript_25492:42-1112(-)